MDRITKQYTSRNIRLRNKKYTSYQDFLSSDLWKQIKELANTKKQMSNCFFCKSDNNIILHHVRYSRVTRLTLNYLLPTCKECHDAIHKINFCEKVPTHTATVLHARRVGVPESLCYGKGSITSRTFYPAFWS